MNESDAGNQYAHSAAYLGSNIKYSAGSTGSENVHELGESQLEQSGTLCVFTVVKHVVNKWLISRFTVNFIYMLDNANENRLALMRTKVDYVLERFLGKC